MNKIKKEKYETEEQKEVKKFIFVVIGLVIIIVGVYLFTRAFVTKDLFNNKENNETYTEGIINYDVAIVGNMLNRPYDEYYLIAFDSENTRVNYYNAIVNNYVYAKDSIKIYHIDLANELNKKYISKEDETISNKFESIEKLKLGEITLIKVKNGKVTKYLTTIDKIKEELTIES